ncbi:hypothetical protein RZS08_44970, partial [Arthrospira platensis SPKY1]|nr:hypothetical protein [Arthrospira platensis SPKY1]
AWIYASGQGGSHAESVALFRSYFPPFLQARGSTAGVSLLFCAAAMALSLYGNNLRPWYWKAFNISVVVLAGLLILMNLWSMM